ncbi:MAG: beta-ketoacyl-ACP synthase [Hyphomicrobiaceae bacterium]|nr:MAG: beta-ketoacyl-ACP synthase [Hyphomicrobiaceae bacterium]
MPQPRTEAWITGIGLVSSLGEGLEQHWQRLGSHASPSVAVEEVRYAPYPVHPLVPLDFSKQIPKTSDQRQMERWQRIGVYAAGLALADAGILGKPEFLDNVDLAIAAGNGERDLALDTSILESAGRSGAPGADLNRQLMAGLRPTLYLGQLSNLLAGNISIVHKATGSSRTFKGEEMAGVAALEDAVKRITSDQSDLMLAGAALNAERQDLLLNLELGGALLQGCYRPVWARGKVGGGMVPGSIGVFLVLESPRHAIARGARPYARVSTISATRSHRAPGQAASAAQELFEAIAPSIDSVHPLGVLSGVSGVEPVTHEEATFLDGLARFDLHSVVRAYGSVLGHGVEAHFISGIALAALALSKGSFFAPFQGTESEAIGEQRQVLVTAFGHWRGEALGLVEAVAAGTP